MTASAFAQVGNPNTWTGVNAFSNAGNSFTGNGTGLSNVNAALLGGLGLSAIGQLAATNTWSGINSFTNVSNSYVGSGTGLIALNATNLTSGTVPSARVSGAYSLITGVGTITTGTWQGTAISATSGGTGLSGYTIGSILYASTSTALAQRLIGATGQVLKVSGGLPVWAAISNSDLVAPLTLTGTQAGTHIVRGTNASTTNASSGLIGDVSGVTGSTYGVYGLNPSTTGRGVFGQNTSVAGVNFGVYGQSASTTGIGTFGWASATSGTNYGVVGESTSVSGRGVYGHALATSGSTVGVYGTSHSPTGKGIFGEVIATTGTNYGVQGLQSASFDGWAVFASGDFGASGNKAFRIDHPFDPENKYLLHYASESPYPQNFYSGNVITDSKGYSWVELPDYFEAINANYKYHLTVIDTSDSEDFVWAKVVAEIEGNRFKIRSNKAGIKVSWRVESGRNDPYNQQRRPREVIEKQGIERGTYQHPELYGMPPERGMNFLRNRENSLKAK
jgi:hypothetical protein